MNKKPNRSLQGNLSIENEERRRTWQEKTGNNETAINKRKK